MHYFKVARPSIFIGTPSMIFESLIFKQMDLYCKTIMTCELHLDYTLLWYYFLSDRNKCHVAMTSQWFNTVTTYESFSLTNEEGVSNEKALCNHA